MKIEWIRGWPAVPGDYWFYGKWNGAAKVRRLRVNSTGMVVGLKYAWDFLYRYQVDGEVWHARRDEPVPDPPEGINGDQA
jgi:hypothetical protein